MTDAIDNLGQVLGRDMHRLALHADNLANANTIGFRAKVMGANGITDTTAGDGKLHATGNPLDVAVVGEGWLVLASGDGALQLTRNGHFHVDNTGWLVSGNGLRVQGTNGDLFAGTPAGTGRFSIDSTGTLSADDHAIGKLLIATAPEKNAAASALPDGGFVIDTLPAAAEHATLATGVLEYANVDVVQEMTQLMTTSRHLESTQRALQLYDAMLGNAINQIGKE